jgi:Fe-S-cluster-containing dehydrogenase component
MAKYAMIVDTTKCNGCYNCFLACRDEFCGNDYPGYAAAQPFSGHFWMRVIEKERGKYPKVKVNYTVMPCMHCDNPTCAQGSVNNAVIKRPDGIVWIDPVKSKGQKEIVSACPHRVIYWNQEKEIPQKCNLCAHLLDKGWKEPRCVEACPTGALIFGDLDDKNSAISKLWNSANLEAIHPEYGLKPRVKYIGLPKRFIAGSVIFKNKKDECAEGVTVTLTDSKGSKKSTKTNNYGDFEFEDLAIDAEYTVKLEYTGYVPLEIKAKTKIDVYLGDIVLAPQPKAKATAKAKK